MLWRNIFLASARMHYQRQSVVLDKNGTTYYYGLRTVTGQRRSDVLAVYADRPSKLNNARPTEGSLPCLHIEWRTSGSRAAQLLGIVSLGDLVRFDHQCFWDAHVHLYKLPKKTQLGRVLAGLRDADAEVSGTALRKRATNWQDKWAIDGNFIMHNAVLDEPGIRNHLTKETFAEWLDTIRSLS